MLGDLLAEHVRLAGGFPVAAVTAADRLAHGGARRAPAARRRRRRPRTATALFDFRPVLRNSSAMAYALAYCVHTLEMSALRGWGVAFLAFVAASTGLVGAGLLSPDRRRHRAGLLGTIASVIGNEAAIRFGRRRLVVRPPWCLDPARSGARFRRLDVLLASPSCCCWSTAWSCGSIRRR